ncbi:MAG: LapA family protein [Deltaproteobacteria bacterium]|nr:LapA family protein [Deltaproteobacteria bacterium]
MKRLIFALIMAIFFFAALNFVYCNLNDSAFGYNVVVKFAVPYLLNVQSIPIPLGFALLAAFSAGMVAIALLEALPGFLKTLEIRSKNKRIKQLEKELTLVRQMIEPQKKEEPPKISNLSILFWIFLLFSA